MAQAVDQVLPNNVRVGWRKVLRAKLDFVSSPEGTLEADVAYWISQADSEAGVPPTWIDYPRVPLSEMPIGLGADVETAIGAYLASQAETIDGVKQRACDVIDAAAGAARARFVTTTPMQDGTYTLKFAQAEAYLAAGAPADASPFPWIALEAQETGRTPAEAAQRFVDTGTPWTMTIGPLIESKRVGFKDKVTAAETVDAALDFMREGLSALDAIRPE
jgi:hypothetical protein